MNEYYVIALVVVFAPASIIAEFKWEICFRDTWGESPMCEVSHPPYKPCVPPQACFGFNQYLSTFDVEFTPYFRAKRVMIQIEFITDVDGCLYLECPIQSKRWVFADFDKMLKEIHTHNIRNIWVQWKMFDPLNPKNRCCGSKTFLLHKKRTKAATTKTTEAATEGMEAPR